MDDLQHLAVKRDGDVTTVTLDRPEKRNALALDVMQELTEAAGEHATAVERSILVQMMHVGPGGEAMVADLGARFGAGPELRRRRSC